MVKPTAKTVKATGPSVRDLEAALLVIEEYAVSGRTCPDPPHPHEENAPRKEPDP